MARHRPRHRKHVTPSAAQAARVVGSVVGVGLVATGAVASTWPAQEPVTTAAATTAAPEPAAAEPARELPVSRSGARPAPAVTLSPTPEPKPEPEPAPTPEPEPLEVVGERWTTAPLNVWTGPGESFDLETVLEPGVVVRVTGAVEGEWAQIVRGGEGRWVRAAYLVEEKPQPEPEPEPQPEPQSAPRSAPQPQAAGGGVTMAACPDGTAVESGLTPDAVRVYRSVCAQFPEVTSWGGTRSDGTHGQGRAVDVMVASQSLGDRIADWVRANASRLGVTEVIWAQRIWTVERGGEGWRAMEDRGSATANHYDHVHVTVHGYAGG